MGADQGEKQTPSHSPPSARRLNERRFVHRVLITVALVVGIAILFILVWQTIDVLLLVFAGILFGLVLDALAGTVRRVTRLKHGPALVLTVLLLLVIAGTIGWLAAPRLSSQFVELRQRLPQAIQNLQERVQQTGWGSYLINNAPAASDLASSAGKLLSSITSVFSKTVDVVVGMLVVLFVTIYIAVDPQLYLNGVLGLVPKERRARACQILGSVGHTLRSWMVGQFCSMVVVGLLTGIGLWALGVPLALLIGILAGLLDFVPIVGTILSAAPAVLLAFLESPARALYVVLLYTAIHQAEAHLILPLIQQRAVSLPPVVTILALVVLGRLFGLVGLLLAAPIAATLSVLVKAMFLDESAKA